MEILAAAILNGIMLAAAYRLGYWRGTKHAVDEVRKVIRQDDDAFELYKRGG